MRLELGKPIACRDGELGKLADVVLDPGSGRVTHLVVQPRRHDLTSARLVQVAVAEPRRQGRGLTLRCTRREFNAMDPVRQLVSVPLRPSRGEDREWDVGKIDAIVPMGPMSMDGGAMTYPIQSTMVYDRVPKFEIELGRTSPVCSSDGHHLGHVVALIVDRNWLLSGFVLARRRLWMRRHVVVPANAVQDARTDLVTLRLTKREAAKLPTERAPGV